MPWNPFKRRPRYVAPTGPIVVTRDQFKVMQRTTPTIARAYQRYAAATTGALATQAFDNLYTESLKGVTPTGNWQFGGNNPPAVALRFPQDQGLDPFLNVVETLIDGDIGKMATRRRYIQTLKGRARGGQLEQELGTNTEPENTYYTPPQPVVQPLGAPPVPPKPQWMIEQSKATAWLQHGVQGNANAFGSKLRELARRDGSFPLGADDRILRGAWRALVPGAPAYRGWNAASLAVPYPSDAGGAHLLNEILADMATTQMPNQGDDGWYDYALYLYGATMTSQPFTDGNKRACRLAYALMLISGGVDFKAPNATFGGRLAAMM